MTKVEEEDTQSQSLSLLLSFSCRGTISVSAPLVKNSVGKTRLRGSSIQEEREREREPRRKKYTGEERKR